MALRVNVPRLASGGGILARGVGVPGDHLSSDRSIPTRNAATRLHHANGGYYHDGRYPNLLAVVDHYNSCFNLGLSSGQKADLVQFLKSR
jgi:hypothetical protein